MKNKVYIGIDNGVTGSIGIISDSGSELIPTPVKMEQSYTKAKQNISRIDYLKLFDLLCNYNSVPTMILIERPMVNPTRFKASASALRALEATLIAVESLGLAYSYIDSKEWQKVLLPSGSSDLKKDSMDIACRLFPSHSTSIKKHKDGDGLLIAEYCRRKFK